MQPQVPRIVMIGDTLVGKTSLVYRLCKNTWNENQRPTVSTAFYTLKGDESQDQQSVQIWDTAGAERYRALNSVYYHNAMGGILVFDLTRRQSFESLDGWVDEFLGLAQPGAILVIVGNKLDKLTNEDPEEVKPEEAERWAREHHFEYFSTSAQDGTNVQELANYLLNTTPQRTIANFPSTIDISDENAKKKEEKKGCCGK
ncbi:small GTP-binding protein [Tritrichomonas foetus]|uniref:Small GTP-binding protein n=1 Tax=Tritrichomonas foetus TaxID=1144522 RepID=A0A1J4L0T2_9EUKA|nr:small GTP-binding protein [Tritrichomonas foetus]|eukprot:OHT16696.1 small GTP-binding protein [Tritrichomonas foetus]